MIKNIDAKLNFSDKDKTILSINHNYFMRTAVATLSDMFLTFLIVGFIAAVVTFIGVMLGVHFEGGGENGENMSAIFIISTVAIDSMLALFYFVYIIVKIARISKMRKHVNRIENDIIEHSIVGTKSKAEDSDEEQ